MTILATLTNQTIPSGTFTTAPQVVPANTIGATLRMTRQNWPSAGVTISMHFSFDGGTTYPVTLPTFIAAWFDDGTGKHPLSDTVIGYGWSNNVPTHVKAQTVSPSSFVSTVTIEAL